MLPLDSALIRAALPHNHQASLGELHVFNELDSTQTWLLNHARQNNAPSGSCCFAEFQFAGRGRNGRQWLSPRGAQLAFSLLWHSRHQFAQLNGLSLVIGAAIATALTALGASSLALKWPNDLHWQRRKLGGVLIETSRVHPKLTTLIIGIGINVQIPAAHLNAIDQPAVDLFTVMSGQLPNGGRNTIAAALLNELLIACAEFEQVGCARGCARWRQFDEYNGQAICLTLGDHADNAQQINGIYRGIDAHGGICIENAAGQVRSYVSGSARFIAP
ncbi:biotin--[acetyl-CoA-carboxylase] ligase [Rhodoferax sp. 4810]|nr:biotin--[acetyl-CoA-carboxylase] ligase [Rhodoferax jenense]